jgi:hypothetical protein
MMNTYRVSVGHTTITRYLVAASNPDAAAELAGCVKTGLREESPACVVADHGPEEMVIAVEEVDQ